MVTALFLNFSINLKPVQNKEKFFWIFFLMGILLHTLTTFGSFTWF